MDHHKMNRATIAAFLVFFVCSIFTDQAWSAYLKRLDPDEKPGVCPKPKPGQAGICVEACQRDVDCSGAEKCCSNGCGHVCMNPENEDVAEKREPVRIGIPRAGCPKPGIGMCVERCSDVAGGCSEGQLCCFNGCGHTCMYPVRR